jgi:hypothetical protein
MAAKKKPVKRGRPKSEPSPQLSEVIDKLHDALALLSTASKVLMNEDGGRECTVLRLGVSQLEAIVDDLDAIDRHQKKGRK